jgi:hypothetical protein
MEAVETFAEYDVSGRVVFDPDPTPPLEDWDHAWTLIGDSRCPYKLDERAGGSHFGFRSDFRDPADIQYERSAGDTVALLRVYDLGANGGKIQRVDSLEDCNAIARIDAATIAGEWTGDRARAYEYLNGILETLNSYYSGDVFGFIVDTPEESHTDSCWGFIGDLDYVTKEMRSTVKHFAAERRTAALLRGLSYLTPYSPAF